MSFNAFRKGHIYWGKDLFSNETEQLEKTDFSNGQKMHGHNKQYV